jgi:rsbT co-antagonist protein RsbR
MQLSQRQSILTYLLILCLIGVPISLIQYFEAPNLSVLMPYLIGLGFGFIVLIGYWYGWSYAPRAMVVVVTLIISIFTLMQSSDPELSIVLLLPAILALVCCDVRWVIATAAVTLISFVVRIVSIGLTPAFTPLMFYVIVVVGIVLASIVQGTTNRNVEQARQRAEDAAQAIANMNIGLESQVMERTAELEERSHAQSVLMEEQAHLLSELQRQHEHIRSLSVPVIPISAKTIVMPLIGTLDHERISFLRDRALAALNEQKARQMILDVTGVAMIDTVVAQGILSVVRAARLMGAEVILVGIRPEVAETIVSLGVNLNELPTYRDLADALQGDNSFHGVWYDQDQPNTDNVRLN